MIISVNWLKKFAKIDEISIDELAEKIGARLVEIESVENLAEKYKDVILAKVVSCINHPDSDHLHICKIDDNGIRENVARDENGFIQVVCGAPNIRENLIIAWLPPNSIVPETFSNEKFELGSRKLRGEMSHGMIASPRELDLWDEHEGILEVFEITNENRESLGIQLKNSKNSFANLFELNDYLLEVENKSLTHRPDCFGIIGFAREVAAICQVEFTSPEYFSHKIELENLASNMQKNDQNLRNIDEQMLENIAKNSTNSDENDSPKLSAPKVEIADAKLCNRYECIVLSNVDGARKSSLLRETYLSRVGVRPISASVDITNFLMMETGQPLHAFDYDKLCKISPNNEPNILVRAAKKDEKLVLLDSREIILSERDIVICAGDQENSIPIALAGAMGGFSTAIDDSTKNILLESATFNLYNLRGTQFRHGIFSEAITRFTKGQSAELTDYVLREAVREFVNLADAKIASEIVDNYPVKENQIKFEISIAKIHAVLGKEYSAENIAKILRDLQYENMEISDKKILVTAPWWRTDLHIDEDIIEDIGRANGYDEINPILPKRDFTAIERNKLLDLQMKIREILASFGANEVLTYSFISEDLLKKVGQNPENSYKIVNSISPELQYVRQSLTPNLLAKTYENLRAGFDNFALFEINQVFQKQYGLTDENVPKIFNNLAMIAADKNSQINFYDVKKYLVELGEKMGVKFDFRKAENLHLNDSNFEPKRTAKVFLGEVWIGFVGELRASVARNLKLPTHASAFEISLDKLQKSLPTNSTNYQPIAKFQGTSRDLTVQVAREKTFAEVENIVQKTLKDLPENFVTKLTPIDIFAPNDSTKNITLRIDFVDREKTIDTKFVANVLDKITKNAINDLNAKVI